ncbi:UNVERIFIED_CONTAM: hypothetical protein FKN15_047609 [Acipenser sinensis]
MATTREEEEQREEWRETVIYEVGRILSPLPDSPEKEVDKVDREEEEVLEVDQDTGAESVAEEGMEWAQALAVRNDEELNKLNGGITIAQGGVLSNIQAVLLPKKTEKPAKK